MSVFLGSNVLDLYNILNANYLESPSNKVLQDGALLIASRDKDSITIYPRKNAVTVWGYNRDIKMLFAFNITYLNLKTAKKTKVLQLVYEEIAKQSKSSSSFEVRLIKGYKGESKNTVNTIENWIEKNNLFQKSQEDFSLCKGLFSVIDSHTGKRNDYQGLEPVPAKLFRLAKKSFSILCHQESSIKIPS